MGDELAQKGFEMMMLKLELGSGPSACGRNAAALKIRRDKQKKMEVITERLSELEELERVEAVKKHAIESGLVVSLYDAVYNRQCAICLDDPETAGSQSRAWKSCCGQAICCKCNQDLDKRLEEAQSPSAQPTDFFEARQRAEELSILKSCQYCRAVLPTEEQLVTQMLSQAQQGKAWAQLLYGNMTEEGVHGVTKDRLEAKRWYTLAADQGCATAMEMLGRMFQEGFPEARPQPVRASESNGFKYMKMAARNGSTGGLWYVAEKLARDGGSIVSGRRGGAALGPDGMHEAAVFYFLSAAQGYYKSQFELGNIYMKGGHGVKQSSFSALCWYRKAALQGCPNSQLVLSHLLHMTKKHLFDGHGDIVGHSAIPEARYWYSLYQEAALARNIAPAAKPTWLEIVQCGCCANKTRDLQNCASCKSVGYCGKECQIKHWKMGHKADCQALDEWKTAMQNVETKTNVHFTTGLTMEM
jgi:TPR repeat protein